MRRAMAIMVSVPLAAGTGGCVAKTAWNVATLPVRATGKAVDLMTTSPSERDAKWARQQRKQAEQAERDRQAAEKRCRKHREDCPPPPQ